MTNSITAPPLRVLDQAKEEELTKQRIRLKRKDKRKIPRIRLGDRDYEILRILYEYKFVDSQMLIELLGDHCRPPNERGRHYKGEIVKRFRKLFDHGYVKRPVTQPLETYQIAHGTEPHRKSHYAGSDPIVYSLGDKGLLALGDYLGEDLSSFISLFKNDRYRSLQFIKHTLMRNRFRACLELAIEQKPNIQLVLWKGTQMELSDSVFLEVETREGAREKKPFPLIPDDFFTLQVGGKRKHFIVEAERSKKNNARTKLKMRLYYEYGLGQRKLAEKTYGIHPNEGLQVLYLAPSWERRNNLRDIAIKADPKGNGSSLFLFASETDYNYRQDPERIFDPIWLPGKLAGLFDQNGEADDWVSFFD